MTNTKVNFLNFMLSIGNRLLITNLTILVWGEKALGELGVLLAFLAGSTFVASIFELQISKGQTVRKETLFLGVLSNIVLVVSFRLVFSNSDLPWFFLLLIIQIVMNLNLIFSGYFFSIDKFVNYRKNCMKSEIIELIGFLCFLVISRQPLVALICSLLLKNLSLLMFSTYEFFVNKKQAIEVQKNHTVHSKSHIMDVTGAQLMASIFPVLISDRFGAEILGLFMFYRQFFMLGGALQSAIFRGLWRDQINGNINTKLLRAFTLTVTLIPAIAAVPVLYLFEIANLPIFVACGITFFILNWNRLSVLIEGHIFNKSTLNAEIIFVTLFAVFSTVFKPISTFDACLISAAFCSLGIKVVYERVAVKK